MAVDRRLSFRSTLVSRDLPVPFTKLGALKEIASAKGITLEEAIAEAIMATVTPHRPLPEIILKVLHAESEDEREYRWYSISMERAYRNDIDLRAVRRQGGTSPLEVLLNAINTYITENSYYVTPSQQSEA